MRLISGMTTLVPPFCLPIQSFIDGRSMFRFMSHKGYITEVVVVPSGEARLVLVVPSGRARLVIFSGEKRAGLQDVYI